MRLYHGSYTEVKEPLVGVGRKSLDFGPGFYVTSIRQQAVKWAKRVCVIRNVNTPLLNIFDLDDSVFAQDKYKFLSLLRYDSEWLNFIVASRRCGEPWKNYDIIQGGVANDQVIDTVEDYYEGRITVEQALGLLHFAKPTHQMCISNQEIVDNFMTFVKSERI